MSPHDLAEQTAGLASRLNNLAVLTAGPESEKLLALRDELSSFAMRAIETELDEEKADYQTASNFLAQAIAQAGLALNRDAEVAKVIDQVEQAEAAIHKVLS